MLINSNSADAQNSPRFYPLPEHPLSDLDLDVEKTPANALAFLERQRLMNNSRASAKPKKDSRDSKEKGSEDDGHDSVGLLWGLLFMLFFFAIG